MQRALILVIVSAIISTLVAGCSAPVNQDTQAGYGVLFDGTPVLAENNIYYFGTQVGNILGTVDEGSVTRVKVRLQPELVDRLGNAIAFYVQAGRMEVAALETNGQPLENGALLSGFTSKTAWRWFKLKTVLGNRIAAAQRRAVRLNQHMH